MENLKKYQDALFSSLLEGNRLECGRVMKEFRKSNLSIIELYEDVFL